LLIVTEYAGPVPLTPVTTELPGTFVPETDIPTEITPVPACVTNVFVFAPPPDATVYPVGTTPKLPTVGAYVHVPVPTFVTPALPLIGA
jgi:hypothetical protein